MRKEGGREGEAVMVAGDHGNLERSQFFQVLLQSRELVEGKDNPDSDSLIRFFVRSSLRDDRARMPRSLTRGWHG